MSAKDRLSRGAIYARDKRARGARGVDGKTWANFGGPFSRLRRLSSKTSLSRIKIPLLRAPRDRILH